VTLRFGQIGACVEEVVCMGSEQDAMGPISYLIVEFPDSKMNGEGLASIVDLVDRGLVRVIDLTFVTRDLDGSVAIVEIADFDGDGALDLAVFEGAASGLMDEEDIAEAGSVIAPGASAGILIIENRWAAPFTAALRRGGAELVAAGFIPQDDLVAALDAVGA
jgi:hypothetical protein